MFRLDFLVINCSMVCIGMFWKLKVIGLLVKLCWLMVLVVWVMLLVVIVLMVVGVCRGLILIMYLLLFWQVSDFMVFLVFSISWVLVLDGLVLMCCIGVVKLVMFIGFCRLVGSWVLLMLIMMLLFCVCRLGIVFCLLNCMIRCLVLLLLCLKLILVIDRFVGVVVGVMVVFIGFFVGVVVSVGVQVSISVIFSVLIWFKVECWMGCSFLVW